MKKKEKVYHQCFIDSLVLDFNEVLLNYLLDNDAIDYFYVYFDELYYEALEEMQKENKLQTLLSPEYTFKYNYHNKKEILIDCIITIENPEIEFACAIYEFHINNK